MMMNPLYHEFSMLQTKLIPRSQIEVKQEIASGTVYIRTDSKLLVPFAQSRELRQFTI